MQEDYHRQDISDWLWSLLEPLTSGQPGQQGAVAKDNRIFLNDVLWVLRTGSP